METPQAPYVHNNLKLPFFVTCAGLGIGLALYGGLSGRWMIFVLALAGALVSVPVIFVIRTGRHPRWLQSPFDNPQPKADGDLGSPDE